VLFAFDIGFSIDLEEAERHISDIKQRETIRRTRKAPQYFQYRPPPLRVSVPASPPASVEPAAAMDAEPARQGPIDFVIYDFGAVSVIYRIPLSGSLEAVHRLGLALYDNERLLIESRRGVEQLLHTIRPAVQKPHLSDVVEDYVIFQFAQTTPAIDVQRAEDYARPLAQILRAETDALSPQEVEDSLACRISFGVDDLTIIDWNATIVVGTDMDDVLGVLEFANVELLEMRFLDDQLDAALTEGYTRFSRRKWSWPFGPRARVLRGIARLQLDSAILFEGVNNTLKLLGDPYLARVYRLAAQRLHLAEWDASILRKLSTVESIYEKISDQQSALRMELLEWIIILLIAVSIVISLK
jgi:hypothetical protein